MGFNYLQTDDRDDYFSQFGGRGKKPKPLYNIYDETGSLIIELCKQGMVSPLLRKHFGLTTRWGKRGRARKLAISKGYKIEPIKQEG